MNKFMQIFVFMISLIIAGACPTGEYEITIERQYANNDGEKVAIAAAESSFLRNNNVFRDESVATQGSKVNYKVCIDGKKDYNLDLSSTDSTAWSKGSFVCLTYNKIIIAKSSLKEADNRKKTIKFNLSSILDSNADWKYLERVDSASWKESKLEEWGKNYMNKEIKTTCVTTYFRKDITVDDSFTILQLSVRSQSGFVVYINGIQVSSTINKNTPSQSIEDIPTYKHIIVPKELLSSSVTVSILKIAIELHTIEDHPELLSSFDVLSYTTNSIDIFSSVVTNTSESISLSKMTSRRLETNDVHVKVTYDCMGGSNQKVLIKSEDGTIRSSITFSSYSMTYDLYGPPGIWSFELSSTDGNMWPTRSFVKVYVIDDNSGISTSVSRMRTISEPTEIYYVNTFLSMLTKSEWKYNVYDSLPTQWHGFSVTDTTWTTYTGSDTITPTSSSNQYFIFRKTIPTPSIENQVYFILSIKTLSNAKIYINDHELATIGYKTDYEQSTDASTIVEKTASGPITLFDNQAEIVISVMLFDNQRSVDISFDASLIMNVEKNLPVYGDFGIMLIGGDGGSLDYFVDLKRDSYTSIFYRNTDSPAIVLSLSDGYKYFTRYCITRSDDIQYLASTWIVESIDINGSSNIISTVSNAFSDLSQERECFSFSDVTTGTNKIQFTFVNSPVDTSYRHYTMGEIELFADSVTSQPLLPLTPPSNPYNTYDDTTINIVFSNYEYYHDYSIIPSLPDGLYFDDTTFSIKGVTPKATGDYVYTIYATTIYGKAYTYVFTIHVESCSFPKTLLRIQTNSDSISQVSVVIKNSITEINVYEKYYTNPISTIENNICLTSGTYKVTLTDSSTSEKKSYAYMNKELYNEFISGSTTFDIYLVPVSDSILPISYSYDNINPPKHWTTRLFNDNIWSAASSIASLPDIPEDSITQYYRFHLNIDEKTNMQDLLRITTSTYAGMVIYMNGVEVRRINMNNDDIIEYNTLANSEYQTYKQFKTYVELYSNQGILVYGDNIIAIEIHKYNTIYQPSTGFLFSASFDNEIYFLTPKFQISSNGQEDPSYPLTNLIVDDSNSAIVNRDCVGTTFTYEYENDEAVVMNSYAIHGGDSVNPSYIPTSFVIEASNDGITWTQLDLQSGLDSNNYSINKSFTNGKSYNKYRIRVTECGGSDTNGGNKAELQYFGLSYSTNSKCTNDNNWLQAINNKMSYKSCPKGYYSDAARSCSSGSLGNIQGDETCIKNKPSEIFFKEPNMIMIQNQEYEQYYTLDAVDTDIIVTPELPVGLTLDIINQKVSGIVTTLSDTTTYTLSYVNNNDSTETYDISITVKEPFCKADGVWPQTNSGETASISCPIGYTGSITRYCNSNYLWEESNKNGCKLTSDILCTGTTYLSGTECIECENGIISSLNGNNYLCTPCGDDKYFYNGKCLSNNIVCPAKSNGFVTFPETKVGRKAAIKCSNDDQFGYYYVSCDYISGIPTWSNEVNKENCYPRPSTESGKGLQLVDYSFKLNTCPNDITDLLIPYARTFIQTYPFELTDLKIAANYDLDTCHTLPLQVYFGTNTEIYDSATYKQKLYIKNIAASTSTIQESSSSLDDRKCYLYDSEGGCQHLDEGHQLIPANTYHSDSYFCKQYQLKYTSLPIKSFETSNTNIYILGITIDKVENSYIDPEKTVILYKSIIASIDLPLKQLQLVDTTSNTLSKLLSFSFYIVFPEQIEINSDSLDTHINISLMKEQIKTILIFENSDILTQLHHFKSM
ncbi:hypothetical protein WA158_006248 [Blastocystis sp. Blastoise]